MTYRHVFMALPSFFGVLFCVVLFSTSESVHKPSHLREAMDTAAELPRSSSPRGDPSPDGNVSQVPLL